MASKGAGAGSTGLWNLHAGWLKVSLIKHGFDGYKKELTLSSPASPGKMWKDRWAVINSNKVCLYMDERCIQETAVFALGPEAVIRVWETVVEAADEAGEEEGSRKWKTKSITGLHIRERLGRMKKKKEQQKMTVLNEILQGCFELRDANGTHLVAKPKTFSAKEVDLWVENVRHAVSMLQGEVRMKGWVLAPEAKPKPRNKTALDAGIEKDIVIHAVAHNIPKKKSMLFRKSSIASNEAKWFCLLKGKVLRFFNNEDCDESDQPNSHTMGISAFTRVEAAGNLKFGIYKEDSQHPELASFRGTILNQENYNQWLAAVSLLVQEERTRLEREIANTPRFQKIVVTARACTPTVLGGAHQIATWAERVKPKEMNKVVSCSRCGSSLSTRVSCRVCSGVFCQYCAPERPCLMAFRRPDHVTAPKNVCWTCTYIFEILVPQEIDRKAKETLIDESTHFSQPVEMEEGFVPPEGLDLTQEFLTPKGRSKVSHATAALARVDPEDYPAVLYIRSDRLSEERGHDVWYQFKDEAREKEEEAIRAALSKDTEKFNKEKQTMSVIIQGLKAGASKATREAEETAKRHQKELAALRKDMMAKRTLLITQNKKDVDKFQMRIKKLSKDLAAADKKAAQHTVLKKKFDALQEELEDAKRRLASADEASRNGGGEAAADAEMKKLRAQLKKLEADKRKAAAKLDATTSTAAARLKEIQKFRTDIKELKEKLADEKKRGEKLGSASQQEAEELRHELDKLRKQQAQAAREAARTRKADESAAAAAQKKAQRAADEAVAAEADLAARLKEADAAALNLQTINQSREGQVAELERNLARKAKQEARLAKELEEAKAAQEAARARAAAEVRAVEERLAAQLEEAAASGDDVRAALARQRQEQIEAESAARDREAALELQVAALRATESDLGASVEDAETLAAKLQAKLDNERASADAAREDAASALAALRAEFDGARGSLSQEGDALRAQLADEAAERTRLELELQSASSTHEAEVELLRTNASDLKGRISAREEEKAALARRLEEARQAAATQREEAERALDALRNELESHSTQQDAAAAALRSELADKEAARLRLELELESEQRTVEMKLGMLQSSGDELQAKLLAGERERHDLRQKLEAERRAAELSREQAIARAEQHREELTADLLASKHATDQLRSELTDREAALRQLKLQTESEQATWARKLSMLEAESGTLRTRVAEADDDKAALRAKLAAQRKEAGEQLRAAQDDIAAARDKAMRDSAASEVALSDLQTQLAEQEAAYRRLALEREADRTEFERDLGLARARTEELRSDLAAAAKDQSEVQARLEAAQDAVEAARQNARAEKEQLREEMAAQIATRAAAADQLRAQLARAEVLRAEQEMQAQKQQGALQTELDLARAAEQEAAVRLADRERARAAIEKQAAQDRATAEKRLAEREAALDAAQATASEQLAAQTAAAERLRDELSEAELKMEKMRMQAQTDRGNLENQLAAVRVRMENQQAMLEAAEKNGKALEAQLQDEMARREEATQKAAQELRAVRTAAEAEKQQAKASLDELRTELAAQRMSGRRLQLALDNAENRLATELGMQERTTTELRQKLDALSAERMQLQDELSSVRTAASETQSQLQSKIDAMADAARQAGTALADAEARANSAESRAEALSAEIESTQSDFKRQLAAFQASVMERQERQRKLQLEENARHERELQAARAALSTSQTKLLSEESLRKAAEAQLQQLQRGFLDDNARASSTALALKLQMRDHQLQSVVSPVLSDAVLYPADIYALTHGEDNSATFKLNNNDDDNDNTPTSLSEQRQAINVILWMSQRHQSASREANSWQNLLVTKGMWSVIKHYSRSWEDFLHLDKGALASYLDDNSAVLDEGAETPADSSPSSMQAQALALAPKEWRSEVVHAMLSLDLRAVEALFRAGVVSFNLAARLRTALARRFVTVAHVAAAATYWGLPEETAASLTAGCTLRHDDVVALQNAGLTTAPVTRALLYTAEGKEEESVKLRRVLEPSDVATVLRGIEGREQLPFSDHSVLWGAMTVPASSLEARARDAPNDVEDLTSGSSKSRQLSKFAAAVALCPILTGTVSVARLASMAEAGQVPAAVFARLVEPHCQGVDVSVIAHLRSCNLLRASVASALIARACSVVCSPVAAASQLEAFSDRSENSDSRDGAEEAEAALQADDADDAIPATALLHMRVKETGILSLAQLHEFQQSSSSSVVRGESAQDAAIAAPSGECEGNHVVCSREELSLLESFMTVSAKSISAAFVAAAAASPSQAAAGGGGGGGGGVQGSPRKGGAESSRLMRQLQELCSATTSSHPHRWPFHVNNTSGGRTHDGCLVMPARHRNALDASVRTLEARHRNARDDLLQTLAAVKRRSRGDRKSMERQVAAAQEKVAQMRADAEAAQAQARVLREAEAAASTEARQLRDDMKAVVAREASVRHDLTAALHARDHRTSELEDARRKLRVLQEEHDIALRDVEDSARKLDEEAAQLRSRRDELQVRTAELEKQLHDAEADSETRRRDLLTATTENLSANARLDAQESALAGVRQEVEALEERLAAALSEVQEAEDHGRRLQSELHEAQGDLQQCNRSMERAAEREVELGASGQKLKEELEDSRAALREEEVRVAQLEAQLQAAQDHSRGLTDAESRLQAQLEAQRALFREQREALVVAGEEERGEHVQALLALRRELAAQRTQEQQELERQRIAQANVDQGRLSAEHQVKLLEAELAQLQDTHRDGVAALQEAREKLARLDVQLQQAAEHNDALSASYTKRTDELLSSHGQQVDDLQTALDRALTERATMAQRLAVEELRVREVHEKALDEAASLRATTDREVDAVRADAQKRLLETQRQAAQDASMLETEAARAAALYGAESAQLAREHELAKQRAEAAQKQCAEVQEQYTNYVEKMKRDAEEAAAGARDAYKAELEALHAKYQEEFNVMLALDKNRAKQSMVAMKRLQTASSRAQEDSRQDFDAQLAEARRGYDRELKLRSRELEHMRDLVAELRAASDESAGEIADLKATLKRQARHYRKKLGAAMSEAGSDFDVVRRSLRKVEKAIVKSADNFEELRDFTQGALARRVAAVLKYSTTASASDQQQMGRDGENTGSAELVIAAGGSPKETTAAPRDIRLLVKTFERWIVPLVAQMLRSLEQRHMELRQKDTEWVAAALAAAKAQKAGAEALSTAVYQLEEEKKTGGRGSRRSLLLQNDTGVVSPDPRATPAASARAHTPLGHSRGGGSPSPSKFGNYNFPGSNSTSPAKAVLSRRNQQLLPEEKEEEIASFGAHDDDDDDGRGGGGGRGGQDDFDQPPLPPPPASTSPRALRGLQLSVDALASPSKSPDTGAAVLQSKKSRPAKASSTFAAGVSPAQLLRNDEEDESSSAALLARLQRTNQLLEQQLKPSRRGK